MDTIQAVPNFKVVYEGLSLTVTLSTSNLSLGLVAGTTYRFTLQAVNIYGSSDFSEETRVALGTLPPQPNPPTKVEALSSISSIAVTWNEVIPTDGVAITGYKLYMDDGYSGNFFVVYDGTGYPYTTSYTAVNLTTGLPYRFYVVASNINGDSVGSNIAIIYSCLIPSGLNTPIKTGTTTSSIAISWNEPNPNGCPITGFAIYRDTGNNDPLTV